MAKRSSKHKGSTAASIASSLKPLHWHTDCSLSTVGDCSAELGQNTHWTAFQRGRVSRQRDIIAGRTVWHIWRHESYRPCRGLSFKCLCGYTTYLTAMPRG